MSGNSPLGIYQHCRRGLDPGSRSKHRTQNQWLICAWAQDGINRNVTVNILSRPVTLLAREAGTIYQKATTTNLTLLDLNGPFPTLPATLNPPRRDAVATAW